ncbi:hypothetical protein RZ56_06730 [Apilactobacillus kunkeei]|nr:hypothetical protein RZ56_06730 [Apilactobacillus kunkeei]
MTKTNVPRLRFRGGDGEWKEDKLGAQLKFINGRAYKQNELLEHGKYKVLRVGNFYTNNEWFYSDLELDDKKYVSKGDLIYTWSATFGPHIWEGDKVIYHYHIWKIELSDLMDKNFVLYFLEYDKNNLLRNTNGSTMIHVTKSSMENKEISFPEEFEQQKIGSFFAKIDKIIELQNQKLGQLKKLKRGYLQKMFPQDGESLPRLRFSGFSGEWKELRVKDIGTIVTGNTPSKKDKSNYGGENVWITPSDIYSDSTYLNDSTTKLSDKGKEISRIIPKDSVIVTCIASIGKNALSDCELSINQQINAVIPNEKFDPYFLLNLSNQWSMEMNRLTSNASLKIINRTEFSELETLVPEFEEQQKIGSFLRKLDQMINDQSDKINELKQQKKAYLQKMFI